MSDATPVLLSIKAMFPGNIRRAISSADAVHFASFLFSTKVFKRSKILPSSALI